MSFAVFLEFSIGVSARKVMSMRGQAQGSGPLTYPEGEPGRDGHGGNATAD